MAAPPRPSAALTALLAALAAVLALPVPAAAHDTTSTAYADVRGSGGHLEAVLDLEYDLLMKSAWLYAEAYDAEGRAEQRRQLRLNADAVTAYVTDRFAVGREGGADCAPRPVGDADVHERGDRPFAVLTLAYDCPGAADGPYRVSSALFPDAETFVHGTRTIVHYDVDGQRGSRVLTAGEPTLTTGGAGESRQVAEFFRVGAEHLLFGPDHLLFLLALLLGTRGLREVVRTATAFTAAHSVTFLLAATGLVSVPTGVVEPVIAASIAVVAVAGPLTRERRGGDRWRLPAAFGFGLVHGLGFAGSLGIDESRSWELLLSLLSFNLGVEAMQLVLIAVAFWPLRLLRGTSAQRWALPALTVPVVLVSLYWCWDRTVVAL
ncbi:HupE/UreJ family protein [Streptomyces flavalbus]|uniref:HupE/UreJ family protein n=1 Tax=Streptomyces flavalbus TaxID=2665155 RepID=A0ABW2W0B3_9ACTN